MAAKRSRRVTRPVKKRASSAAAKARVTRKSAVTAPDMVEAALAAFAHEVRTPLTGILAISNLLATSELGERERRWVDTIKAGAEHLASLATLFVDAARSSGPGLNVRQDFFDLRTLARKAGDSLTGRAAAKGLQSSVTISDKLPGFAVGDSVRLRAAVENLIDNAVKFTERGRVALSIEASTSGRRVRVTFEVADSGIGIVAADLRRLFKPFAQANAEVARRFGGSGLGLAFARRVAQAMGGDLTVKTSPGRGSTFRLVVVLDAVKSGKTPGGRRRGSRRRLRLLCVEDNPYGRVVLNTVLDALGHDVSFAETGEAAIAAIADSGYDAVLMDVALPGIDGFDTARRIRALPGQAGLTPLVGVSGRTDARDEEAALAAGMDAYLRKPAGPATLEAALVSIAARGAKRR
jgi:CheY-like chemotaxis protein/nitrogen-specific signal transduction histidine kinase